MTRRKRSKKQIIKLITQYGFHIWAILIIANAVMFYAYHFATHAATNTNITSSTPPPSISVSPNLSPSPSTAPLGPTLSLSFSVPGIGSGGGVMKPLHIKRPLTIYLFAPDVNSQVPKVNPLYTIQTTATFDTNPLSPTYTSFVNPLIDLGSDVKEGNYQIAFRTNLSLRTLIKQNPTDLGGEVFNLAAGNQTIQIPEQTVLMGDVVPPQGDNNIDINDYNAFISCYGSKNNSTFCKGHNYGDFNDDGVIDGVDYNILLRSLNVLAQEGIPVPKLSPKPAIFHHTSHKSGTLSPKKKSAITPPSASTVTPPTGGNPITEIVFFFLFIILLCAIAVVLYFKNEKAHTLFNALIHLSPTGEPSESTDENTTSSDIASTTEEQSEASKETETPSPVNQSEQTGQNGIVEKDCYVKTKGLDDTGTGMWLLLTDDNGAINAHYAKADAKDGFAKVKGSIKTEKGKTFLEVSELTVEG